MSNQITITFEQWAFVLILAVLLIGIVTILVRFINLKEFRDPKLHLYLINKDTEFYLPFNLNDIKGIRQFNETNKPILCQYLGGKRMITFEGFLLEAFIDHIQDGYAPELFDVSAQTKLHNAKKRIDF